MTADFSSLDMAEPGKEIRRSPVTDAKQRPGFQTAATRVALVQMQCGPEPEANLAKAVARVREAAKTGRTDQFFPPRAFPVAVFLPIGGPRQFRVGGRNPGALDRPR